MRNLIIRILVTALSFYVTSQLIGGFKIEQTWSAYAVASLIFVLCNWIAGPIVKLLLLPINLLTLGLFRWVANVAVLYIFDILYDGVSITAYRFSGFQSNILSLPAMDLSFFWVLVLSSFAISIAYSIVSSLVVSTE